MSKNFTVKIIDWYLKNKRDLPWRETSDPYTIWLSEIILQQTRVAQGLPYFNKFINKYPSIEKFAAADEDDILKLWQGLGYYSRARNMMTCAKTIVTDHYGVFPDNYKELLKLKGIGKYTAAAIASICFQEPVSVIDGNVYRVLSRVFGMENDLSDSKTYNVFFQKAQELIDPTRPNLFNQSMMEFGAIQCTPKKPNCINCSFSETCFAFIHKMQSELPVKTKKVKKTLRYFDYFMLNHEGKLLIRKRPKGDIWSGLYDFLLIESDQINFESNSNLTIQKILEKGNQSTSPLEYKHILTHQTIFARFYQVEIDSKDKFETIKNEHSLLEIDINDLETYPVPVLIERYLKSF